MTLTLREAVENPAVDAAVTLADAFVDEAQEDLIRHRVTVLGRLLQLHLDRWVLLGLSLEDFMRAHIHKTECVGDHLSLSRPSRTWGSNQHDLGRASGRVVTETAAQHTGEIVGNLVLSFVLAVHVVDELIECFGDRVHVNLILHEHTLRKLVSHVAIDVLACRDQVLLDARQ